MKRGFVVLVFALASSASAGVTYRVQSRTSGVRAVTIAGKVAIEGAHMRMDVLTGDNLLFRDNAIVLSSDGGKTMAVLDPSTRNYYELQLDQVLGSSTAILRNLGAMVKVSFDNPHVVVRDAGDGGTLEGFPTRKYVLDASYDVAVDAMGQKMSTHMAMTTESWTTDQLSPEFSTFLQMRGLRTGIDALDKLIEAQSSVVNGLPLKEVSTLHMNQGGNDVTMTTTALVTNVQKGTIEATMFAMPAGYTRVDDPISTMLKQLKQ